MLDAVAVNQLSGALPFFARIAGIIKDFDYSILRFLNSFATHSWYLDRFALFISGSQIIKAGLIVSVLWWYWFRPGDDHQNQHTREKIISAILACLAALFLARSLSLLLPFRVRPIGDAALGFKPPLGSTIDSIQNWSSFPSDHAVLVFTLAMSIWYISKRLGWILFAYATVLVCLPRLYLGVHYPTDVLAGVPIGIAIPWFFNRKRTRDFIASPGIKWEQKSPFSFYACFFLVSYEIANLFDQTRMAGRLLYDLIRHLFTK
jgi:undecaprenyl-diphosphatase